MLGQGDGPAIYVADPNQDGDISFLLRSDVTLTSLQFQELFKKFILQFTLHGETLYKEQLRNLRLSLANDHGTQPSSLASIAKTTVGVASLRLDLEHLAKWHCLELPSRRDADLASQHSGISGEGYGGVHYGEFLLQALRRHPLKFLPPAEAALKQVYAELMAEEGPTCSGSGSTTLPELDSDNRLPYIQLEVISRERATRIRDLKANEVESLVVVPGIVIQAAKPVHKASLLKLQCKDCKTEKYLRLPPWRQGGTLPRTCDAPRRPEEPRCGLDPFLIISDESSYCDVQTVKLQELPEDVPTGDMPRHLVVNCGNALCGRVTPGERVSLVGVFSSYERQSEKDNGTVRGSYIHALGLDYCDGCGGRKADTWTYKEEDEFRSLAQDSDIVDKITKSVAPAILGLDDVKRSIACLLFGGARKQLPDATKIRGDLNILLLGDPSTAKSQFLKFVQKCSPIAVYTSGKGSSAAGLTAAIVRDSGGNFALEGGAMVLADGGVVCIDEFDKMRDDDRVAIHEAMEQQTISIAKAGITTVLNTKCAVLAAANPSFGSYDDSKDTTEQHDFEATILSRFDMIWLIRDERNVEKDKTIARHVFALHAGAGDCSAAEGPISLEKLRGFIDYSRTACDPRLSEEAAKRLENYYVEVRDVCRTDSRRRRDQIPISVRQLESLARIAESLARMQLSQCANENHVEEAIRLFQLATVEASKSSISRENLTPAERQMITAAEEAILNRLPVHSRASKSTIIRDLQMRGYEIGHVGRALRILIQKGILEERGDASVRRLMGSSS